MASRAISGMRVYGRRVCSSLGRGSVMVCAYTLLVALGSRGTITLHSEDRTSICVRPFEPLLCACQAYDGIDTIAGTGRLVCKQMSAPASWYFAGPFAGRTGRPAGRSAIKKAKGSTKKSAGM